jgi:murein L,D-transpeptidase YcbB/YkuD
VGFNRRLIAVTLVALGTMATAIGCASAEQNRRLDAALRQALTAPPPAGTRSAVWADVRTFYSGRGPAWTRGTSPSRQASAGLRLLRAATEHGLDPAEYGEPALAAELEAIEGGKDDDPNRAKDLAAFDVRMSTAVLSLGRDVAIGRVRPESISSTWKSQRRTPDLAGTLRTALDGSPVRWLDRIRPAHPEYVGLQTALLHLIEQQGQAAPAPRARPAPPASDRITRVRINLDRWRWMPNDLGARHFFVNIPAYQVVAREGGTAVFFSRVVVGKPATKTPVFSAAMNAVVFSPYWNIPETIVLGETVPAVLRDPNYLTRNQIEILRVDDSRTQRVSPSSVNWDDPAELESLAFRQRPGAANALGHVKFVLPNPYGVYLHDTPADSLFDRDGRAFSHGCVRVEEPRALAEYVLRGRPEWPAARIEQAMRSGTERRVPLERAIPVHVAYFTAWVDVTGTLKFEPDIYGFDAVHARLLK